MGARLYDAGQTDEGAAFAYLGNGKGRPRSPAARRRQRRRLGAQSVEADIRLPEPGRLLLLASGAVLLAALRIRRAAHRARGGA